MVHAYPPVLLLQITEGIKSVTAVTEETGKLMHENSTMSLLWWIVMVLLVIGLSLGITLVRVLGSRQKEIETACLQRLEGYHKSELELKSKHALEIALNEANHQGIIRALQKALDESTLERRELTDRLNSMARDMAELFDTFAAKINTFAELQAAQVARLETFRAEVLLEITRLFSRTK